MKKFIALFLVFSIIGLYGNLYAKERRGANVEIFKTKPKMEGTPWETPDIKGELIAVKESSLLLLDSASGADVSIDIGDIKVIKIVRESKVGKGVGIGLLVGGGIGAAQFIAADKSGMFGGMGEMMIGGALVLLGVVFGAFTGAAAGQDITIQIEGKSDTEIKEILEDLRKKARVPDFQ